MGKNIFRSLMVSISVTIVTIMAVAAQDFQHQLTDSLFRVAVEVNDTLRDDSLFLLSTTGGLLVEAQNFSRMLGGTYHAYASLFSPEGMMIRYGKLLSFAWLGYDTGFCNCLYTLMIPSARSWLIESDTVYFAPCGFLSNAIAGVVSYDKDVNRLKITAELPQGFGYQFPPARDIVNALQDSGFTVQQGGICHANAIQFCAAGYVPNCNGNNASFPYLIIQVPPPPGVDSPFCIPIIYNFKRDEAVVAVGKTPPKCRYFSYRSYMVNRLYSFPVPERLKIYASLGDTKNLYTMREDKPLDSMFQRKVAFIMSADSLVAAKVKNTILSATNEIFAEDIYFDVVPHEIFRLGTDPFADWGNFLHRVSLFDDTVAGNQYIKDPTLEIMRITPDISPVPYLFSTPSLRSRISGKDEFHLLTGLGLLEDKLWDTYHETYQIIWLQPGIWLIEGYPAIQQRVDVLGEVRDALYMRSASFSFRDDDIAVVYGVNHTKTGKAVYSNVSCYGDRYKNGFGGITNMRLEKTAREYVQDSTIADLFFVYKFSRHPIPGDPNVFIVPADTLSNLMGINVNDTAFMAFRAYIDTITKVGPDEKEVILDRTILLRKISPGIESLSNREVEPSLKIYPNPTASNTTLEINLLNLSDVWLSIFTSTGQPVAEPFMISHVRGTVRQEIRFSQNLPSGTYVIRAVIRDRTHGSKSSLEPEKVLTGKIIIL